MKSIALVCGSEERDGIFIGGRTLFETLKKSGYEIQWYQCSDAGRPESRFKDMEVIPGWRIPGRSLRMGFNRLFVFPRKARNMIGEDILFLLDPSLIRIAEKSKNFIVKIHDVRPLTQFRDKISTSMMFRYSLPRARKASHIIVSTHYMKHVLTELGFDTNKIDVIPETVSMRPESSISRQIDGKDNLNVLYVATDRRYKNIQFVFNLAKIFSRKERPINFQIVSRLKRKTSAEVRRLKLPNLEILSDVTDMGQIYRDADILVFPSLYEGFGLPLIEAMSFGLPVICNNIEPMTEIVGNSGILVETNSIKEWTIALERLTDAQQYARYSQQSVERSKNFSEKEYLKNAVNIFSKY